MYLTRVNCGATYQSALRQEQHEDVTRCIHILYATCAV